MSFEGYEIHLCRHGHLNEEPYRYGGEDAEPCPDCGESPVWIYVVDCTNDAGVCPELELFNRDMNGVEQYYVPDNKGLRGEYDEFPGRPQNLTVPTRACQFIDRNNPEDGPFAGELDAWNNKVERDKMATRLYGDEKNRRR